MALSPRVKALLHDRGIAGYEDISGEDTAPQRQISSNVQGMLEKRKKQIAGYDKVKTKKTDKRQYSIYGNDEKTLYRSHLAQMAEDYARERIRQHEADVNNTVQDSHSMSQTDFFRADREQAARDYAKQRLSRFQSDFYGNLTPNTYLDSASSEELSALGKAEKNRGKLADMAEEYAKIRTNRTNNTVISSNLDTASSADLSAWAQQAKGGQQKSLSESESHGSGWI